mgnify:CR=1 FL=1
MIIAVDMDCVLNNLMDKALEIEKLNEELEIQKSDVERLSVYIEDAIQMEDYEEAGDMAQLLKDTCVRIAKLSSKIDYLKLHFSEK